MSIDINFEYCDSVSEIFALLADYKKKGVKFAWADQMVTADYVAAAVYKAVNDVKKSMNETMFVPIGRYEEVLNEKIQCCLIIVSDRNHLRSALQEILKRDNYHSYLPEALTRTVMDTPGDCVFSQRIDYERCKDLHELLAMVYEQEMQNRVARKKKGLAEIDSQFTEAGSPYWLANFLVKMADKYEDAAVTIDLGTKITNRRFHEKAVEALPEQLRDAINNIFRHQDNIKLSSKAVKDLICAPYEQASELARERATRMIPIKPEQKPVPTPIKQKALPSRHLIKKSRVAGLGAVLGALISVFYYGTHREAVHGQAQTADTSEDKNAINAEQREQLLQKNDIAGRYYVPVAQDIISASDAFVMLPDGTVFEHPTEEQKQLAIDKIGEMQTQLTAHLQDGKILFYVEHPGEARDLGYLSSIARWSNAGTVDNPSDDTLYINKVFFDQLQRYWTPTEFHEFGHAFSGSIEHKDNIEDLDRNSAAFMQEVQENRDYSYYLSGIMRLPDDIMQYHVSELHNNPKADLQLHDNEKELQRWRKRMLDYVNINQEQLAYLGVSTEEIGGIIAKNNLWELMNLLMEPEINNPEGEFYGKNRQPKSEARSRRK